MQTLPCSTCKKEVILTEVKYFTADKKHVSAGNKEEFGVDQRVKKLLQFVARLEGFEPPTP